MKIILPVNEKSMKVNVNSSFGRANYFLLYNSKTKEQLYLENIAQFSSGGAGIKAAQIIVDSGANVVLTERCGENAANVLKKAGVALYQVNENTKVEKAINDFLQDKLPLLLEHHSYHRK